MISIKEGLTTPEDVACRYNRRFPATIINLPIVTDLVNDFRGKKEEGRITEIASRINKTRYEMAEKLETETLFIEFKQTLGNLLSLGDLKEAYVGERKPTLKTTLPLELVIEGISEVIDQGNIKPEILAAVAEAKTQGKDKIYIVAKDQTAWVELPICEDSGPRELGIAPFEKTMQKILDAENPKKLISKLKSPRSLLAVAMAFCKATLSGDCEQRIKLGKSTKITDKVLCRILSSADFPFILVQGTKGLKNLNPELLQKVEVGTAFALVPKDKAESKQFKVTVRAEDNCFVVTTHLSRREVKKVRDDVSEKFQKGEVSPKDNFLQILLKQVTKEIEIAASNKKAVNLTMSEILRGTYRNLHFPLKEARALTAKTIDLLSFEIAQQLVDFFAIGPKTIYNSKQSDI